MSPILFYHQLRSQTRRLRRHLAAVWNYQTPRRLANLLRIEYEYRLKREVVRGLPYVLVVDPLNVCNLRCPLCPTGRHELPLKPGRMDFDSYRKIIDQLGPTLFKVILYNWGEPFLHRDILPMVEYAHERRIATAISSNLNVLPTGGGEAIVRSGLDDLILSCDGLSQETYEHYRVGGSLEAVKSNLREISEARRRLRRSNPNIEFQFLVFRHNEHETSQVERFARELGADEIRIRSPYLNLEKEEILPASNPEYVRAEYLERDAESGERGAGSKDREGEIKDRETRNQEGGAGKRSSPKETKTAADIFSPGADPEACAAANPPPLVCYWPWRVAVINWNGQVDPCCGKNYLDGFGNVFETPFETIWNGPAYRYARRWIAGRARQESPQRIVCRGCPGYR